MKHRVVLSGGAPGARWGTPEYNGVFPGPRLVRRGYPTHCGPAQDIQAGEGEVAVEATPGDPQTLSVWYVGGIPDVIAALDALAEKYAAWGNRERELRRVKRQLALLRELLGQ